MGKLGINQRQVKTTNQSLIISEVRKAGQISRSDLAKKLKLSAPSISTNIDDLISRNIIQEMGTGKSYCGRKPIILEFNNNYGYIVAIDMISSIIRVALADLTGTNILEYEIINDALIITNEVIEQTIDCIKNMLIRKEIEMEKLLCICIGSPGIIDPESGKVIFCPRIKNFEEVNLKDIFKKRFNTDVIIKNDVNCATVGEHLFGVGRGYQNFINIYVDIGTGSGLILNDQLFEGSMGAAGEFGLWTMNISEAVIENKVTLSNIADNHISIFGLVCLIKEKYPDVFDFLGNDEINLHVIPAYTNILFEAVKNGDSRILSLVQQSAVELGCIIKNICELLDLELVIIGGLVVNFGEFYFEQLKKFLQNNTSKNIKILSSDLGDKAVIYGALGEGIRLVLKNIVEN